MSNILIVEDEPDLALLLRDYLEREEFNVHIIKEGYSATDYIRENKPDLILLDLMLPGKDGLTVCKEVRQFSEVPIIITTARVEEIDRLLGLESGADDYVCKPYSPREVVARVKVILRRLQAKTRPAITDLELKADNHQLMIKGVDTELTTIEFKLFQMLHDNIGVIFTREQIMHGIYDDHRVVSGRTIDSHVKKIRKKIQAIDPDRDIIHSVYGAGYKLEDM